MANLDVIRTLTIRGKTEGVAESTAELQKLSGAYDAVSKSAQSTATVTDMSAKRQLSLASALQSAERRFNTSIRAQQDFERVQRQMNAAVAQNPALQERANAVIAAAALHFGQASASARLFANATENINQRLSGLAAGAGPLGSLFAGLGAGPTAAVVGIGAAAVAFKELSNGAHDLAQKAVELRQFSDATGLTTDQVQALRSEASKFLLTSDEAQTVIQNFTARFNELRLGSGELLTQIRKINPALALQMQASTDTASALTLLGKAIAETDNVFERSALARAAGGRSGTRAAAFLSGLNVDAVTEGAKAAGRTIDEDLIQKLAELQVQIDKTAGAAKKNLESIFAQPVLEAELAFLKVFRDLSAEAKNFSLSADLLKFFGWAMAFQPAQMGAIVGRRIGQAIFGAPTGGPPAGAGFGGGGLPDARSIGSAAAPSLTPEAIAANLQKQISALGDAATFAQRLDLAQKQLAISGREAGLSEDQLAKASSVLSASSALQALQTRVGLLGELATGTDAAAAAQLRINLAVAQGVRLSPQERAAIIERTRLQQDYSRLLGPQGQLAFEREQFGRNDIEAATAARLRSQNLPIDLNSPTAQLIRFNEELRQTKAVTDEFAQSVASNLTSALADFTMGTKTASESFKELSLAVVRSLEEMIIKMTITLPIARALQSVIGGFLPTGGGGASPIGYTPPVPGLHGGGVVGKEATFTRYVHPAYFENAPRFHTGFMPNEIPAILQRGESVLTAAQMSALGGALRSNTVVNVNVQNHKDATVSVKQKSNGQGGVDLTVMVEQIEHRVADNIVNGRGAVNSAMTSRYGLRPQF